MKCGKAVDKLALRDHYQVFTERLSDLPCMGREVVVIVTEKFKVGSARLNNTGCP
jgi:hypothetical protein